MIVHEVHTLSALHSFFAYNPGFGGGVRVAAGDLDNDGVADIITGAGPGGGPHVRGFRGNDLAEMTSLFAYDPAYRGGVFVAGSGPISLGSTMRVATNSIGDAKLESGLDSGSWSTIASAAIERSARIGLSEPLPERLRRISPEIAGFPASVLGLPYDNRGVIDDDAARHRWFADETALSDDAFILPHGDGAAADGVDLLSVVLHEFGRHLHDDGVPAGELMAESLGLGIRPLPSVDLIDALFATSSK